MSEKVKQAVILAGGRGERLRPFTDHSPKPMYPVCGKPFIDRLIEQVKSFGITEVLLLLGYKAEQVQNELGDGSKYGIKISYDITPPEYDTVERLLNAESKIRESFLLMYCDNYCPIDFEKLNEEYKQNNALVQFSVYANKDQYTKDNLMVADGGRVITYDKTRKKAGLSGVDIGYAIVCKEVFELIGDEKSFAAVYPKLVAAGKLYATVTEHRYYSIGGYERMALTEEFFREKKVVFLDRDGTLNVKPPKACYVENVDDFRWLPGAKKAIKKLKDHNVVIVLISNQPGIARGNLTVETLNQIHDKMQTDLKKEGSRIDYIYYCPHNWDEGCDCRKPKPGMLYQAQKDLSLDLTRCVLFGDDERDIEAGTAAGCKSILVTDNYSILDAVEDYLEGRL